MIFSILFILFFGCAEKKTPNLYPERLNIALPGDVPTLDPALSYDTISATLLYQIYEPLYQYHYLQQTYTITPLLADGMPKISKNGTLYTIKVKPNIHYHSHPDLKAARTVRAQDFITQIKRIAFEPTQSTGWWLLANKIVGINEFRKQVGTDYKKIFKTKIKGIRALDELTLEIQLKTPLSDFINYLTLSFIVPLPEEIFLKEQKNLTQFEIGTGPYYLEKYSTETVLLKRFINYRTDYYPSEGDRFSYDNQLLADAGKLIPFLSEIQLTIDEDVKSRADKFLLGEYDLLVLPKDYHTFFLDPFGNLKNEFKNKGINLDKSSTLLYWWISFNMNDPIIGKNHNLRKAIAHAIDTDLYINRFTHNTGLRANSILPPGIIGYDPAKELPYGFDLKKAKYYLTQAGFPNGEGLPPLLFPTRGKNKTSIEQALFFQEQLKKIGIKIQIQELEFNECLAGIKEGKFPLFLGGWALDYPTADNVFQLLQTDNFPPGPNSSHYQNPLFDNLITQYQKAADQQSKLQLISTAEAIVQSDLPWVMLYYSRNYTLYHGFLKNQRFSDIILGSFKYLKK